MLRRLFCWISQVWKVWKLPLWEPSLSSPRWIGSSCEWFPSPQCIQSRLLIQIETLGEERRPITDEHNLNHYATQLGKYTVHIKAQLWSFGKVWRIQLAFQWTNQLILHNLLSSLAPEVPSLKWGNGEYVRARFRVFSFSVVVLSSIYGSANFKEAININITSWFPPEMQIQNNQLFPWSGMLQILFRCD